jgi:hypothetical protein
VGRHGPGWTKIDDAITLLDDCMILLSLVSLAILGNRYISGINKNQPQTTKLCFEFLMTCQTHLQMEWIVIVSHVL